MCGVALGPDREGDWSPDTLRIDRSHVAIAWTRFRVRYAGAIGAGGTIVGTWTEDEKSQPLVLARATANTEWRDPAPHTQRFVTVEKGVRLETLDWGGTGRPVVLLAGLGNTAHVFDQFALKLTSGYHVFGITRRGFGDSSAPESGYLSDSLADDVLTALDSLGIEHPVLIGHSIAGQEMSSIATRHPERVAGLVYLEAGYAFAVNPPAETDPSRRRVNLGTQKYTDIHVPVLAFFALPQETPPAFVRDSASRARADSISVANSGPHVDAFERGIAGARVVRVPHANHYVFRSNEAEVLQGIRTFIAGLR